MNPLALAILFIIIRPIIKGLAESSKKKQAWEKKQKTLNPQQRLETNTFEPLDMDKNTITLDDMLNQEPIASPINLDKNITQRTESRLTNKDTFKKEREVVTEIYEPKNDSVFFNLIDEENILRGIILKEVLDRPKFLR